MKIAPPKSTKAPEITGTPQQAQTLTEVHGTWENSPTGYTYKWQQCNSSGTACTVISGATAQTYVPVAGDVGHTIKVEETASNEGGSGSSTSSATAVVKPPPPVGGVPTITGTAQQGQTLTEVHGTLGKQPHRLHLQVAAVQRLGHRLHRDLRAPPAPDLRAGRR